MMMNRGMPGGYGGRPGRIMPQPMPQPIPPEDPNDPMAQAGGSMGDALSGGFKAGGDPNAAQGNAPAMAIPGGGNPLPPPGMGAAMGGMAQAGGMDAPMLKPPMDDPMAAQGGAMGAGQAMAGRLGPGNGGMRGMIRQMLLRKMQGGV